MKKSTIAWWCVAALLSSVGATCDGIVDEPDDDPPPAAERPVDNRPTCPEVVWQDPEERCFTLQTFVESRLGPYDVYLTIDPLEGASKAVYPPHVPIAAGGWNHGVKYRTGKKYHVKMTVNYEGAPTKDGFCSITDGDTVLKFNFRSIKAQGGSPYFCVVELAATTQ